MQKFIQIDWYNDREQVCAHSEFDLEIDMAAAMEDPEWSAVLITRAIVEEYADRDFLEENFGLTRIDYDADLSELFDEAGMDAPFIAPICNRVPEESYDYLVACAA